MATLTKRDLETTLSRELTALEGRLEKRFVTKDEAKHFATKDNLRDELKQFATKDDLERFATKEDLKQFATKDQLADVKVQMTNLVTKDNLEEAVQEIVQAMSDMFASVPNRVEFVGLDRRVRLLEDKTDRLEAGNKRQRARS